jgi:hypothetical protein
MVVIGHIDR